MTSKCEAQGTTSNRYIPRVPRTFESSSLKDGWISEEFAISLHLDGLISAIKNCIKMFMLMALTRGICADTAKGCRF